MCSTYTDHGEEMLSSGGGGDSNVPHFAVFVIAKIKGRKAFSRLFRLRQFFTAIIAEFKILCHGCSAVRTELIIGIARFLCFGLRIAEALV